VVGYAARRLLQAVVVIFILSLVVFAIARLSGDPVDVMAPIGTTPQERAQIVQSLGLDRPLPVQYARFVANALQGNFGQSIRFHAPAMELVLERFPNTVELALAAVALALLVGVPLGVLAALDRGGLLDTLITWLSTLGQAVPSFWLGILLLLWLGVALGLLPIAGQSGPSSLVMPAISLGVIPLVSVLRLTRSSMIEVLHQDFVRTARAKGLRGWYVVCRHVVPNGLVPVLTLTGVLTGQLLGGAVITEQIFAWPGIGRLAIESIGARDYPVVQAVALLTGAIVVALNLLVDLSYFALDPRVRQAAAE
jgi:peptide/nickel transport system permease protein